MPLAELTREQREQVAPNCCGAYVDPLAGSEAGNDGDTDDNHTRFRSVEGLRQITPTLISIDGDVIITQGRSRVTNSGNTSIDRGENTVLLDGDVEFREPGMMLRGTSAFLDSGSNSNRVESARYVLHDFGARGEADSIVYNSDSGLVSIENGWFSRCEPGNSFWDLRAENIIINQDDGRAYARKVSFRLGDVPVFYYPFTMSVAMGEQRKSGFLAPSIGSTRTGGTDIELPYYLNLAPHYDATVAPRLVSDRGVMTSAEFRYLADWSMNTFNTSFLGDDDQFDPDTANNPFSESPPVADRWFVGFQHNGRLGANLRSFIDYNEVSDSDYFYDLGATGLNVTALTNLNQQGRLDFTWPLLNAGVNVQRIQIIDPFAAGANIYKPFDRLPEFYFETGGDLPGGFSVGLEGQVTSFDRELDATRLSAEQIAAGALISGERINLRPQLGWSVETPGWFLRARARYEYLDYSLQNQAQVTPEQTDVGVPVYSLDSGLVFERQRRSRGTQTLEPRLFYLHSEFQDQSLLPLFDTSELNFSFNQLFRDDRFTGGDRIADADQLSLALTTRLLAADGSEQGRFSLGQILYFEDRRVTLANPLQAWIPRYSSTAERSSLAAEAALNLGQNWQLMGDVQWNEDQQEVDEGSLQLRYQRDDDRLLNVSYRYRRLVDSPIFIVPPGIDPRIQQSDVSGAWPVTENWKLLGRWNYDHSNARNLETFLGIEWSNCCATIRLVGREWVDENALFVTNTEPNRGFFVQFTLNGFGNLAGGGVSNLLRDGIWGFKETQYE